MSCTDFTSPPPEGLFNRGVTLVKWGEIEFLEKKSEAYFGGYPIGVRWPRGGEICWKGLCQQWCSIAVEQDFTSPGSDLQISPPRSLQLDSPPKYASLFYSKKSISFQFHLTPDFTSPPRGHSDWIATRSDPGVTPGWLRNWIAPLISGFLRRKFFLEKKFPKKNFQKKTFSKKIFKKNFQNKFFS